MFDPNIITAACYFITAIDIAYLFATTPALKDVRLLTLFIGVFITCGSHHAYMVPMVHPPEPLEWLTALFSALGALALTTNIDRIKQSISNLESCELANDRLRESRGRWRELFNHSAIGIGIVGLQGEWLEVNDRLCEIVDYSREELLQTRFQNLTHPDDLDGDLDLVRQLLNGDREWYQLQKRYLRKDGSPVWILLVASLLRGASEEPLYFVSQILDISKRVEAYTLLERQNNELRLLQNKLEFQANHDSMTGLFNRHGFLQALEYAIAEPNIPKVCLLFIDLDYLKQINDTLGHLAGDSFIRQTARALERYCDVAGRIRGGDEFAGLFYCPLEEASDRAHAILRDIQNITLQGEGIAFRGGASMGLVPVTEDGDLSQGDLEELADVALYKAKHGGRNRLEILHSDSPEFLESKAQTTWTQKITQALDNDALVPYCQEMQLLNSRDECDYCEALVRYIEGDRVVSAGVFIGAISRNHDLMKRLDRWMLKKICTIPHKHQVIAINLSGATLSDPKFVDYAIATFRETGFDPRRLHCEITEQMAIKIEDALRVLDGLRSLGCKIALDDTGTGFSSLTYILELNPDVIKIDGSFVQRIVPKEGVSPEQVRISRALVFSLMQLANLLDKELICEYVEDRDVEQELIRLRDLVDRNMTIYGQGWLYGQPGPC